MKIWVNPRNKIWWDDRWWDKEIAIRRKARREWYCSECGRLIRKGEEYIDDIFIINDIFETRSYHHRVCLKCWKIDF